MNSPPGPGDARAARRRVDAPETGPGRTESRETGTREAEHGSAAGGCTTTTRHTATPCRDMPAPAGRPGSRRPSAIRPPAGLRSQARRRGNRGDIRLNSTPVPEGDGRADCNESSDLCGAPRVGRTGASWAASEAISWACPPARRRAARRAVARAACRASRAPGPDRHRPRPWRFRCRSSCRRTAAEW